jgi:hypothetical protein
MVIIILGALCLAMGWYWLTRPEVIVDRLRARGMFTQDGSRERQLLCTKVYGWTGVALGGLFFITASCPHSCRSHRPRSAGLVSLGRVTGVPPIETPYWFETIAARLGPM